MSFGVPLIVTDIGAPATIAKSSALVFKNGDIDSLIEKIELIITDETLRKRLRSNCKNDLKNYDRAVILDRIIGLYENVLENN